MSAAARLPADRGPPAPAAPGEEGGGAEPGAGGAARDRQLTLFRLAAPAAGEGARARTRPAGRRGRRLRMVVVRCSAALRDAVTALAAARGADPSSLARAALLLFGDRAAEAPAAEEGGEPDFERVVVLTAAGRPRARLVRPRLRLSLPAGTDPAEARRALARMVAVSDPEAYRLVPAIEAREAEEEARRHEERAARLAEALSAVAFRPLPGGPKTVAQAAWMLGFQSEWGLTVEAVQRRYRRLAPVFHPDGGLLADSERMSQLATAKSILLKQLKEG